MEYSVRLHENQALFTQAIAATAQQMGIPIMHVEKDYWVTMALKTVFKSDIGAHVVFKGGTALLKCNHLIKRFSEDIDLVIIHDGTTTDNQLKKRLKTIGSNVAQILPEMNVEGITHKRGMIRKTAHTYQQTTPHSSTQTRDFIVVEATWLGQFEPYSTGTVTSFVGQMLEDQNQVEIANEYDLLPFEVNVLSPNRTICEKIMSLVRFSYTENPLEDLAFKIRHTYDLHAMLANNEIKVFFESKAFDAMLLAVAQDDKLSFKNNNEWLQYHPADAIIFKSETWGRLVPTYTGAFRDLVFGDFPESAIIGETLQHVVQRLQKVDWVVD